MNSKTLIGVVAVVVIVIAVAAVAVGMGGGDDENKGFVGVVYDGNGGKTLAGDNVMRETSNTVNTESYRFFTYDGYGFVSYNTKADGTGDVYLPGDSITYPSGGYVTLYAQWGYEITTVYSTSGLYTPPTVSIFDGISSYHSADGFYGVPQGVGILTLSLSGVTWTYDSANNCLVADGNGLHYVIKVTIDGGEQVTLSVQNGSPLITFYCSGPVVCHVSTTITSS